jgi:chromosome segregation and condensation protein ScpB
MSEGLHLLSIGLTAGGRCGDFIASLRSQGLIGAGPRSPQPGAPYAYVTMPAFVAQFGFESLQELPDLERLEDEGVLGLPLSGPPAALDSREDREEREENAA